MTKGPPRWIRLRRYDAKKGTVRDYAPMAAIPVGVPCFDGQGSTGVVISAKR